MATTVINIRDAPPDWEQDPNFVYIGRAGRGFTGTWGNPIRLQSEDRIDQCLAEFKAWAARNLTREQVAQLKDKTLVCPGPGCVRRHRCHGHLLAAWADHYG